MHPAFRVADDYHRRCGLCRLLRIFQPVFLAKVLFPCAKGRNIGRNISGNMVDGLFLFSSSFGCLADFGLSVVETLAHVPFGP